jgi:hypothetical protein
VAREAGRRCHGPLVAVAVALCATSHAAAGVAASETPADAAAEARADTLFARHDWPGAARAYEAIARRAPGAFQAWYRLGYCDLTLARWDEAIEAFHQAEALHVMPLLPTYNLACALARGGQADSAFAALKRLTDAGFRRVEDLEGDHDLDALRADPRFADVLRRARHNAEPCADAPRSREFDFWIGDWEVHDNQHDQAIAGSSHVERVLGQCVLIENWSGRLGGHGQSLNGWNSECGCWQESWMDDSGNVSQYTDGRLENHAMVFHLVKKAPGGATLEFRLTFFDLGPDQVRQLSELSRDGGRTWVTNFDLNYLRRR